MVRLGGQPPQAVGVVGRRVQQQEGPHVLGVGEAAFGQHEVPRRERGVADRFPPVLDVGFAGDFESDGEVVEGEGEIEAVFRVGSDFKGHFFIALAFEETGNFVLLVVRNVFKDLSGRVHVAAEDQGLVFDNGKGEGVRDDVDVFVGDICLAITWKIAKEVHGLVKMGDGISLVAYKVVKAIGAVGVDEAVANPLARADGLIDVGHDFEGGFNAIFVAETLLEGFNIVLA